MNDAPPANVAEVSLIGSGFGESIIVHLGDDQWIVVDSCTEKVGKRFAQSSPVSYLKRIGVDLSSRVSHVVATHWHDDHVAELSEVVKSCESAVFCCATVLRKPEFVTLAAPYAGDLPLKKRATREIMKVFETLEARKMPPKFLKADTLVCKTSRDVKVYALSPSDNLFADFLSGLAKPTFKAGESVKTKDFKPNDLSVVLLIDLGADSVLLGGDLEKRGWSAVVNNAQAAKGKKSSVYKVAHHGSKTGDCPDIWEKLLLPENPFAVLTPFVRGDKSLPSEEDVERILKRTPNAYSSARVAVSGAPSGASPYLRQQRRLPIQGHLRLRRDIEDAEARWSIELFGDAVALKDVRAVIPYRECDLRFNGRGH